MLTASVYVVKELLVLSAYLYIPDGHGLALSGSASVNDVCFLCGCVTKVRVLGWC